MNDEKESRTEISSVLPGTEQHQQKMNNAERDWKAVFNRLAIQLDEWIFLS
jgi:hypothetical protein